ncbi:MAG TPA: hypothetical protein VG206_05880 [Terriglobia bacterium]|nr:hypothetical protein [Terriglobia bacterium]
MKIPEELATQARMRGMPVEAYAEAVLARQIVSSAGTAIQRRTAEQIQGWVDSLAQFSDKIPALPSTVTRQWIYQDHD